MPSAGLLRERLTIQSQDPQPRTVTSLTSTGTTATVTTSLAHGFTSGDYVTIAGASPSGYVGKVSVTVTGAKTFTYTVSSGLASPATGTITATYVSDAIGGSVTNWFTVVTLPAELVPISSTERLQLAAIRSDTTYRFRVRVRSDLELTMQVLWTPNRPPAPSQQTLVITGIVPENDGRAYQFLDCAVAP